MKKKSIVPTFFTFILLIVSSIANSQSNENIIKQIDRFMTHSYESGLFNGCVLVSKKNEILYKEALGYSDIWYNVPLKIDSKFDIGSLTKSFTAMAIMILEEDGKLSYTDSLSAFFPDFPAYANKITIHHLLCHQSGIPDYANELAMFNEDLSSEKIMKRLIVEELNFEPGTMAMYSNSGYFLLGRIIEKISGLSYGKFISEKIFQTLGMTNSVVYDNKEKEVKNKAIGVNFISSGEKDIIITGDGGVYTTVNDLDKWHQELCQSTLISRRSLDRAFTPAILDNAYQTREGYGWHINYRNNEKIIEHGGASPAGYISYFLHPASCGYSITLLTNFFMSNNFGIVLNGLTAIMNGSEPKKNKSPVMYHFNKYIIEHGTTNLDAVFKEYNSDTLEYTPFDELEFIQLSSFYKDRKQYDKAIAILQIYLEQYPDSKIPLEELVEIYKLTKDNKLLILTENDLKKLNAKLSKQGKIEIQLVNPKTENYEMSLNVRSGPGSEYESISVIKPAESYIVIGRSMNGEWLKLKRDGWIYYRIGRISEEQFNSLPFIKFEEN